MCVILIRKKKDYQEEEKEEKDRLSESLRLRIFLIWKALEQIGEGKIKRRREKKGISYLK